MTWTGGSLSQLGLDMVTLKTYPVGPAGGTLPTSCCVCQSANICLCVYTCVQRPDEGACCVFPSTKDTALCHSQYFSETGYLMEPGASEFRLHLASASHPPASDALCAGVPLNHLSGPPICSLLVTKVQAALEPTW